MPRSKQTYTSAGAATPQRSGVKIPLNDDRQEKANRMRERQAAQEAHRSSIRSAATPNRFRESGRFNSPHTPLNADNDDLPAVTGSAVTPMKHAVPLQANFEEWMRLAKDNKINATNSWGLALIDYFHDMSLLKEGDGVDFQKASTTLDGCVKIYTSRVDSVADDTGRLLNGLAESGNKKRRGGDAEDESEEREEGEDGEESQGKKKSRPRRNAEKTLVDDFSQLQLKKVDAEMGVDPLFKKASADFDEGGAKGLLLNHLTIDSKGRIIFDSSDDIEDVQVDKKDATPAPGEAPEDEQDGEKEEEQVAVEIDLSRLASQFFPDLARLEQLDVCAPLKDTNFWDTDAPLELPFLDSGSDDWRKQADAANEEGAGEESALFRGDDGGMGFDDDDGGFGDGNLPEPGFGEGGEAWARDAALEPQGRVALGLDGDEDARESTDGAEDGTAGGDEYFSITQGGADAQDNILSYFDNALKKNWAGPEHWRIRRIKDSNKPVPTVKRKEKEPFLIDFMAPMNQAMADLLFIKPATEKSISLPKDQRKVKTRNLLPDDKHFNSKQLAHLFLKPKVRIGRRKANTRNLGRSLAERDPNVNEEFFAGQLAEADADDAPQGNYDANFFDEEAPAMPGFDDDDDHFEDALDHQIPQSQETVGGSQPLDGTGAAQGGFGDNLVTNTKRFKPMYMEFARVAKKVDAKLLKENLWNGLGLEEVKEPPKSQEDPAVKAIDGSLKFTDAMAGLTEVYEGKALADLSTSFAFICLLHLANEKGLQIENTEQYEELIIRKDFEADLSIAAE